MIAARSIFLVVHIHVKGTSLCAVHDASNPEFSIFKQRLVNRLKHEGVSEDAAKKIDLVELTKVCFF